MNKDRKSTRFLKRDDEIEKSKVVRDEACCRERERERIEHTFRERKRTNRRRRTGRVENGRSREGDVGNLCADKEWKGIEKQI